MEPNAMGGGIFSNVQPGSMLGLEMSLHHPLQNPQNSHLMQNPHQHMLHYGHHHDENYHHPKTQQPAKQAHPVSTKSKAQTLTLSDDEEPAENSADDGKRKMISPWQRMKWTDNMVRLLIMVVFYIGDEVVSEANNDNKRRGGGGGGGGGVVGVLQKKGKWKSVSTAMMERGFYVSPQQCEDKFNDLNKRYKRVNDILGKGISCRVVENQSLLDTMDHLSPKLKEEMRKLLNSKHLFFREMCAYHNGCGHGSGTGGGGGGIQAEPPSKKNDNNNAVPNLIGVDNEGTKMSKRDDHDDDDEDDDDDNEDDDDDDDDGDAHNDDEDGGDDDDDDNDDDVNFSDDERSSSRKRLKKESSFNSSPLIQQLDLELANILQDGSKSQAEKRQWMKTNMIRLEEERVGLQSQSFEIEKQRLKWLKFSSKKEREMERERLANERLRLENERMVLIVRQKELDLIDHRLKG